MRSINSIRYLIIIIFAMAATPALAYVMSSTNYRIERDSIDMGGGLSSSTNYISQSTIGGSGAGTSTSATFNLSGGYQQMDPASISLTVPGTTALTPSIDGSVGGTASTSASLSVSTNNGAGYTLQIKASTSPALKSGSDSFADYTLAAADPEFDWSVAAGASEFGFTPEGADIATRYKDNGAACNQAGGSDTANRCWDPLTTTYNTIAQSSSGNLPLGVATTLKFQAEAGASAAQPAGSYVATVILTAFAN